jgi:hypothetical protein
VVVSNLVVLIGGNGHGLQHFEDTAHPVSVKLGTITPEGGAGACYRFQLLNGDLVTNNNLLLRLQIGPLPICPHLE